MNGLGNDFLIYDARGHSGTEKLRNLGTEGKIIELCSRSNSQTKGCDQFIILIDSEKADIGMLVYNADGSEVYACGNATRCVTSIIEKEGLSEKIKIETKAGILTGEAISPNMISVDMGEPIFDWKKIPLTKMLIQRACQSISKVSATLLQ